MATWMNTAGAPWELEADYARRGAGGDYWATTTYTAAQTYPASQPYQAPQPFDWAGWLAQQQQPAYQQQVPPDAFHELLARLQHDKEPEAVDKEPCPVELDERRAIDLGL